MNSIGPAHGGAPVVETTLESSIYRVILQAQATPICLVFHTVSQLTKSCLTQQQIRTPLANEVGVDLSMICRQ